MTNLSDVMFELLSEGKYTFTRDEEFMKNNKWCDEAYLIIPKNGSKPFYLADSADSKNVITIARESMFAGGYVPVVFDYYQIRDGFMNLFRLGKFVDSVLI